MDFCLKSQQNNIILCESSNLSEHIGLLTAFDNTEGVRFYMPLETKGHMETLLKITAKFVCIVRVVLA